MAIIRATPNILAILPFGGLAGSMPRDFIQAVPKVFGWYQINPSKKEETAATKIAIQLTSIVLWFDLKVNVLEFNVSN